MRSYKQNFWKFFLIFFGIFSSFLSFSVSFADSKRTDTFDSYNTTKTYSAGNTIRIATFTKENDDSVKVSGFKKIGGEWFSYVFDDVSNTLEIVTTYDKAIINGLHTITENISSSNGKPLRLKVSPFYIAGKKRNVWSASWKDSSAKLLHGIYDFSDDEIENILNNTFQSLGSFASGVKRKDVYIEAKAEAVCEISSGYVLDNSDSYNKGKYVFQGLPVTATEKNFDPSTHKKITKTFSCNSSGILSDTFKTFSCDKNYKKSGDRCVPAVCTLDGVTVKDGESYYFYKAKKQEYGSDICDIALQRVCNNGVFSGNSAYKYKSCDKVLKIDIDLSAVNKNKLSENPSHRVLVSPNEIIDTDFEIKVQNVDHSHYIKDKKVFFSVEYSSDILELPNIEFFSGTKTHPKQNKYSTNFSCYIEDFPSTSQKKVTCFATSHTALDNGITTASIFEKFDFKNIPGKFGNAQVVFKTWTTDNSVIDEGSSNDGIHFLSSSNNIKKLYFQVRPYCVIQKNKTKFHHVLYGKDLRKSWMQKIANSNGEVADTIQKKIIKVLGDDGKWQHYTTLDDTDKNNTDPYSPYDLDDWGTKYFVYPGESRYALSQIISGGENVGYNIYNISCNNEGKISGDNSPEKGVCLELDKHWESGKCLKNVVDFTIKNFDSEGNIQKEFSVPLSQSLFNLAPQITNTSQFDAQDVVISVEYNPEYLEYKENNFSSYYWTTQSSLGKIVFTLNDSATFKQGYTSNHWITFAPKKITTEKIPRMVVYSVHSSQDPTDDVYTIDGNITGVDISFLHPTDLNKPKEKHIPENTNVDYIATFSLSQSFANAKFQLCHPSDVFEIKDWDIQKISGKNVNFEEKSTYNLCVKVGKTKKICEKSFLGMCLSYGDTVFFEYGRSNLKIIIDDINEKPADDVVGKEVSVPFNGDIELTRDLLGIGESFENIDPDNGDENENLLFSGISLLKDGIYRDALSGVAGDVRFDRDQGKIYFKSSQSGVSSQIFWYKICDRADTPLCAQRKVKVQVLAGEKCENPFDTTKPKIISGGVISGLSLKANPQLVCQNNLSITCNNGQWSEDPNLYRELCSIEHQNITLSEKNDDFSSTDNSHRKELFLGEKFSISPTIPFDSGIVNSGQKFSGNIEISFDKNLFQQDLSSEWMCETKNNEIRVCSQKIEYSGEEKSVSLDFTVIGNPENQTNTEIQYSVSGFSDVLNISDKKIFLKTKPQEFLSSYFSGVPNVVGATPFGTLQIKGNISPVQFSLVDANKCSAYLSEIDNSFFVINDKNQLQVKKIFDTPEKKACVKIFQKNVNNEELLLGYGMVRMQVLSGNFLVILPYQEKIAENTPVDFSFAKISGKDLIDIELCSQDSFSQEYFELYDKHSTKNISDISGISLEEKSKFMDSNTSLSALISAYNDKNSVFWKNFFSSDLSNVLRLREKRDFIIDTSKGKTVYHIRLKKPFDFEGVEEKLRQVCVVGKFSGEDGSIIKKEEHFVLPLQDLNEPPQKISSSIPNPLQIGETKELSFSDLGITGSTDPDDADGVNALHIEAIYVDKNDGNVSKILSYSPSVRSNFLHEKTEKEGEWASKNIDIFTSSNSPLYSVSLSEYKRKIILKNYNAIGTKTFYFLLCDNNSPDGDEDSDIPLGQEKCSLSSVTGSFSEPLDCENIQIGTFGAFSAHHNESLQQNFYGVENSQDCSLEKKTIKCFNGSFYLGNVIEENKIGSDFSDNLFLQCKSKCKPFNISDNQWVNSGGTELFYSSENSSECIRNKKLTCLDGKWYDESDVEIVSPFRRCSKSCVYSKNSVTGEKLFLNDGSTLDIYSQNTADSCSDLKISLKCSEGKWKDSLNGDEYFFDESLLKWKKKGEGTLYFPSCSSTQLCSLRWQKLNFDGSKSVKVITIPKSTLLVKKDPIINKMVLNTDVVGEIPLQGYFYRNNIGDENMRCLGDDNLIFGNMIECDSMARIRIGTVAERSGVDSIFDSSKMLYGYCHSKCLLGGESYNKNDQVSVYKFSAGQCIQKTLTCQETGKWKDEELQKDIIPTGFSLDSSVCGENVDGSTEEEVTEKIEDLLDGEDGINSGITVDREDGKQYKYVDTPRINIHENMGTKSIVSRPVEKYLAEKSGGTRKLFESPFYEPNLRSNTSTPSSIRVTLRIRAELKDSESSFSFAESIEELKQKIAVRWKVIGKDKNGDVITLFPVFHYTDSVNDEKYGCGSGDTKSMLCLNHFKEVDTIGNIIEKEGKRYAILEIKNAGFTGKVKSNSIDVDIRNRVREINSSESGTGEISLQKFLNDPILGVTYPEFYVLYESPIGEGESSRKLSYQFIVEGDTLENHHTLSDNRFNVVSKGIYKGIQQKIETTVEKGSLLPVFNYVIFGE